MHARVLWLTAVAHLLLASAVLAQDGLRSASLPDRPVPPLPSARPDLFRARPDTFAPRFDRLLPPDELFFPSGVVTFGGSFPGPVVVGPKPWKHGRWPYRRGVVQRHGYLQLEVRPGTAQVFVDGFFVGTVHDTRRSVPGLPLEAGPHRVELRAPGYEHVTFDVRIVPDETITYRSDLEPFRPATEPVAPAPAQPKTFYVIPGCYAGDKPPDALRLSPGCDPAHVRAIPPVVSRIRPAR